MNSPYNPDGFPVMRDLTVKQIKEYLEAGGKSILLPIGVIEQHGYHLPLSTDALIAEELGKRIAKQAGAIMAPTMYQSFSGGGCPGTINITPATMAHVVSDTLVSLASQGFRNFHLFLCHGGSENARALNDTLRINLRLNPIFKDALISLIGVWDCDPNKIGWQKAWREGDWHAGWLETSLVMALRPELVRMRDLTLDKEPWLSLQIKHPDNYQHAEKFVDDPFVVPRMTQRDEIQIGVMGFPQRASKELGERIAGDIIDFAAGRIKSIESKSDGVYREVAFTPPPLIFEGL